VLAHDPWKAEDKCPRPENGAGAGDQDKCPAGFFYHDDSKIKVNFFFFLLLWLYPDRITTQFFKIRCQGINVFQQIRALGVVQRPVYFHN